MAAPPQQLSAGLLETLTPYQRGLLDTVTQLHSDPITTKPSGTTRTEEQVQASVQIHKRINPGYVEEPYQSTSSTAFKYMPAPDFTRDHLRTSSDCKFQEYMAEAINKHVDLKKVSLEETKRATARHCPPLLPLRRSTYCAAFESRVNRPRISRGRQGCGQSSACHSMQLALHGNAALFIQSVPGINPRVKKTSR